ncbi:MBL fold metallo-hydrolase [bacterium]|nr:MBL fold metallo-hydrolase [bacterium]
MILKTLTVGPFQENCYIFGDTATKTGAIIDPGDEADWIIETAQQTGLQFKFILNTHAHIDHIGAVQAVKDALKIPFYLHKSELPVLQHAPQSAAMFGIRLNAVPEVDVFYDTNLPITLGQLSVNLFFTPGHSPGSVSLYLPSEKIVFGGDVLFNGSIGRTDLPGGNFDTLIHSIKTHLFTLPDDVIVYPGHGPETTIGYEKKYNPFCGDDSK